MKHKNWQKKKSFSSVDGRSYLQTCHEQLFQTESESLLSERKSRECREVPESTDTSVPSSPLPVCHCWPPARSEDLLSSHPQAQTPQPIRQAAELLCVSCAVTVPPLLSLPAELSVQHRSPLPRAELLPGFSGAMNLLCPCKNKCISMGEAQPKARADTHGTST